MNSIQGKRVLITGPTSGVGKETALGLAHLGADLILACRDVRTGERVAAEIVRKNTAAQCAVLHFDASSQDSILAFVGDFQRQYDHLDVLINNAAVSRGSLPRVESVDGIELTFATNVLAYFLLTRELLDLLRRSAPARIINVASQYAQNLDLDDLEFKRRPFEGFKAYAQSKACDRLLTWALARRLDGSGVTVNAMTPGLIPTTGLFRHAGPERVKQLSRYAGGRTPARGADTAIWLASAPEMKEVTDKFFQDRQELECEFRNEADEERLWAICEAYVNGK